MAIETQLAQIAAALSIPDTESDLHQSCFDKAYSFCLLGQWEVLNPVSDQLALLADARGYNLFTRALIEGNIVVAEELGNKQLATLRGVFSAESVPAVTQSLKKINSKSKEKRVQFLERQLLSLETQLTEENHLLVDLLDALGKAYLAIYDFDNAERCFGRAKLLKEQVHGKKSPQVTKSIELMAKLDLERGEFSKAANGFEKVLKLYQSESILREHKVAGALENLATACKSLGEFQRAHELYQEAYELFKRALGEEHIKTISALHHFASIYTQIGQPARAVERLEQVLQYRESKLGKMHPDTIQSLLNLWDSRIRLGDALTLEAAKEAFVSLMAMLQGNGGDQIMLAKLYMRLGTIEMQLNRVPQRPQPQVQVSVASASNMANMTTDEKLQFLGIASEPSSTDMARAYLNRAIAILEKINNPTLFGRYLIGIGVLYERMRRTDDAIVTYRRSVELLETGSAHQTALAYLALGKAHALKCEYAAAEGVFRKAIEWFDNIQNGLSKDEWRISIFQRQADAYTDLERILRVQKKDGEAMEVSNERRARSFVKVLSSKISAESIEPSLTSEAICALAREHQVTFIQYSCIDIHEGIIYVDVVLPSGEHRHHTIENAGIVESCEAFLSDFAFPLKDGSNPNKTTSPDINEKRRAYRQGFVEQLTTWSETLIHPLLDCFPCQEEARIAFITEDVLSGIPFHLLSGKDNFLLRQYVITSLPSITAFGLLSELKVGRAVNRRSLIIDDPSGSAPLVTGGQESQELKKILQTKPEDVLSGADVTGCKVLFELKDRDVIHFSCHGQAKPKASPHSVYQGCLHLAVDKKHPDGKLFADEIVDYMTNARLVFMSACSTGHGNRQEEGVIGLVRSFLATKVSTVIAAHWRAADAELTVQMVKVFYQSLQERGLAVAALRQATLYGMDREPEAIEKWGVFFASGDF